jgi:DNA polymerase-3 subunit beta
LQTIPSGQNLNNVSKGLSNKPQMPILTGIKIDVRERYILLTSSNFDISIQAKISNTEVFDIEEQGTVVLPGKYLIDILRKTNSEEVMIASFEENSVKIIADKSNFTLNTMDKEVFPYISFEESINFINIDAINVKQIIKKTSFATSSSEAKMILTGVSLSTQGPKIEAIATDSFRLAKKYLISDQENPSINVIIPSKNLEELNKILEESDESVQIHILKTKILFKYKNILFLSRLIEGTFPNTSSLIPNEYILSIKFNKNDLISAIDRASLFNTSETPSTIKMVISEDKIEVKSISNEIGGTIEELTPISLSNKINLQIAFSSKYFLDAVKSFDSNELTIHITGEIKPFIITGDYDINHIQLILPTRAI